MAQLDQAQLNQRARFAGLPWRIHCYESVPSTNLLVKNAIEQGESEGYVAVALQQVAGYGRQGRPWVSPFGGVYFSALLRPQVPPAHLVSVGPALSFAVRQALASLVDDSDALLIKWPNDVVCARGKLCGMSCEQVQGALCIGIGVNLFHPSVASTVGGKNTPAYLVDFSRRLRSTALDTGGARQDAPGEDIPVMAAADQLSANQARVAECVLSAVLQELWSTYQRWRAGGFAALRPAYQAHAALIGDYVRAVTITDQVIAEGAVVGIDDAGCLLLRDAQGCVSPVASGEIHLC